MKLVLASCVLAGGCLVQPPPPAYPTSPTSPPAGGQTTATVQPPAGALPSADAAVPIPPEQSMPAWSYSTQTTAQLGVPVKVLVDGRSDIFSAELAVADEGRGGVLPARIALPPGSQLAVSFGKVNGTVGCGAGATAGPDGGGCAGGDTDIAPASGIAGIIDHKATQFLVGVFVGKTGRAGAPDRLDFTAGANGHDFHALRPAVGQPFFVGDGSAGDGGAQLFFVPPGATTLALGIADASSFQGDPGAYGDNTGGFGATLTIDVAK
jgi:hypothetical protein